MNQLDPRVIAVFGEGCIFHFIHLLWYTPGSLLPGQIDFSGLWDKVLVRQDFCRGTFTQIRQDITVVTPPTETTN